jgi:hypothetical protein
MAYARLLDPFSVLGSTSYTTLLLNSATNAVGSVLSYEGGRGSAIGIVVYVSTISSPTTPFTVNVFGVSAKATPNTTPYTTAPTFTPVVGVNQVLFATPYAGTPGDQIAITVSSALASASVNATMGTRVSAAIGTIGSPYGIQQVAGTWSIVSAGPPAIGLLYADGTVSTGVLCPSTLTNYSLTSTSNPYFVGNSYTALTTKICVGVEVYVRVSTGSDFSLSVYSGASSTPTLINTIAFNVDKMTISTGGAYPVFVPLLSPLTIVPGTTYRFLINATTANAFTTLIASVFPSTIIRQSSCGDLSLVTSATSTINCVDTFAGIAPVSPVFYTETASSSGGVSAARSLIGLCPQ